MKMHILAIYTNDALTHIPNKTRTIQRMSNTGGNRLKLAGNKVTTVSLKMFLNDQNSANAKFKSVSYTKLLILSH